MPEQFEPPGVFLRGIIGTSSPCREKVPIDCHTCHKCQNRQTLATITVPVEAAHSMPPESAGSRSPGWRCRGVDVASTGSAQPFIACGVLILPNCRHTLCCTAEWWRRECAGEAGRSRRPRQWRVSGAGSTRFHQTEMVRPAVGAATTVRWSVR